MGQTHRRYPIVEVAISVTSHAPLASGHERKLAGDIIAVRPPATGVGVLERTRYLWLRLDGLEENLLSEWTAGIGTDEMRYEKRRYQIPLERLKEVVPSLNLARVLDPTDAYQPFLLLDEERNEILAETRPLGAEGVVFNALHAPRR